MHNNHDDSQSYWSCSQNFTIWELIKLISTMGGKQIWALASLEVPSKMHAYPRRCMVFTFFIPRIAQHKDWLMRLEGTPLLMAFMEPYVDLNPRKKNAKEKWEIERKRKMRGGIEKRGFGFLIHWDTYNPVVKLIFFLFFLSLMV